ncbi:hypothetical protein [Flavobacterium microcysteis]|uniref:Uncharacterized protein n=1 Tax=Flavobacterium microcysteis TaxID=2596891 RepID=A0A501Q954_9FLAO|nr:hypothetical protein [Flavobacterium microcysteis]TPD68556.1 hypothetical protein FJA49_10870 [Flavobacterium microcysteis]
MSKTRFIFEISGEIYTTEKAFYKDDQDKMLQDLNDNSSSLSKEIEEEARKVLELAKIEVKLSFRKGSILASGWVIIETIGTIADAISFGEYCSRLLKHIVSHRIQKAVPDSTFSIDVNFITPESLITNNPQSTSVSFPFLKILTIATIVNVVLIFGGTLFNAITVQSTLERYQESQEKLAEAKTSLLESESTLKNAQVDYLIHTKQIELVKGDLVRQKDSAMLQINIEEKKIADQLDVISSKRDSVEYLVIAQKQQFKILESKIKDLDQKRIKVTFLDVFRYSHWTVYCLILIPTVIVLLVLFLVLKRR